MQQASSFSGYAGDSMEALGSAAPNIEDERLHEMPERTRQQTSSSPSRVPSSLRAAPGGPDPAWQLVEAVRRGEPGSLDQLVGALSPHVLRAVQALLGPAHPDIEDLSQEALLAVIDAIPSFRGESTLLHFAIRITTRKVTRARRRSRSILAWLEDHWRTSTPLQVAPRSPHQETLDGRRRALLVQLLETLPEAQAEVFVLRAALGLSIEEVAAATRVPPNTVRSRLRLAKEALRRKIGVVPRAGELLADGEVL